MAVSIAKYTGKETWRGGKLITKLKKAQIKDLAEAFTQYSRNTIKKDVTLLVNEGLIINTGSGRGVTYYPNTK